MRIRFDRFPNGLKKALTLSFDDGRLQDRKLVSLLNTYGLKGTFNLNSGFLGKDGYIEASEVKSLFDGHEVAAHTTNHPYLDLSPTEQILREISDDRYKLETLVDYPVRGMSYPFGSYSDQVISLLPGLGIEYSRATASHGGFQMPNNYLLWNPTCHHEQMLEKADEFIQLVQQYPHFKMALFYVWGHSYEFDDDNNWDIVDKFGEKVGGRDDIWYATNAEIVAYVQALKRLRFSTDRRNIHNPSALSVWVTAEGDLVEIPSGQLVCL